MLIKYTFLKETNGEATMHTHDYRDPQSPPPRPPRFTVGGFVRLRQQGDVVGEQCRATRTFLNGGDHSVHLPPEQCYKA